MDELFKGISDLRAQEKLTLIPLGQHPEIFEFIQSHFSSIFQACHSSREKCDRKNNGENVSEADWRHDFDRLLFDFFKRVNLDEDVPNPDGHVADLASASEPTELTKARRSRQGFKPKSESTVNPLGQLQGSDLRVS